MGVQLIGRRGDDGRLLRTARWLTERIAGTSGGTRMTDRLMALFAFALLTVFLGILVWYVPRLDLAAVVPRHAADGRLRLLRRGPAPAEPALALRRGAGPLPFRAQGGTT